VKKEPIIHYPQDNQPYIYGYEILAEKPSLIKTIEDDFNVFKLNFLLSEFNDSKVYHFNLQGRTILKFWKEITELLNKSSHREKVVIELLEGELSANELSEVFNIFSKEDIKVSLDDFGTASSNFDRLIEYRHIVESVKIDRILWKNMPGVVSEILKFGKDNNIKVICEKVESKEELEILISVGVRYLQGWYFRKVEIKDEREDISEEFIEQCSLDLKLVDRYIWDLKELKATTLYRIKQLENIHKNLEHLSLGRKDIYNAIKILNEYIKFLQKKIVEVEVYLNRLEGPEFFQKERDFLKRELLDRFLKFKKNKNYFSVICIYLKGLTELNSIYEIEKIFQKLYQQIIIFFGEDVKIFRVEDFVLCFTVENLKREMLVKFKEKITEFRLKNHAINLKPTVFSVEPSETDESFENFIIRLDMILHEVKLYS